MTLFQHTQRRRLVSGNGAGDGDSVAHLSVRIEGAGSRHVWRRLVLEGRNQGDGKAIRQAVRAGDVEKEQGQHEVTPTMIVFTRRAGGMWQVQSGGTMPTR